MRTFAATTGKGIENEFRIEVRIQNPIDGVMQQPVPNGGLVNVARLRVVYSERLIRPMSVCIVHELAMQCKNIVGQMEQKTLDVLAFALIPEEFSPSGEQVFHGNDIIIDMTGPHFPLSLSRFRLDFESDQRGIFDLG